MRRKLMLLALCVSFIGVTGCVHESAKRGISDTAKTGIASNVGVKDGALISHEMDTPAQAEQLAASDQLVIVQCPACNQRVDVTGLPRDRIRCPNCNSLFTY